MRALARGPSVPRQERGIGEEVRDAVLREDPLETWRVRAFRQPDAGRLETQQPARGAATDSELRFDRGSVEQRQVPMRRRRGEDLEVPAAREVGERADEIAAEPLDVRATEPAVRAEVEVGEGRALLVRLIHEAPHVGLRAADLVVGIFDEPRVDVAVGELLDEDGREADDDAVGDRGFAEIVEQGEEREVGPQHRLVDPFLAVGPAAGPARVRQMRVESENERSHWSSSHSRRTRATAQRKLSYAKPCNGRCPFVHVST